MQKCKSFLKESITFIRYTDRTQSTAINPIAYLPQPYSNNPIQPPQEKTPESLPDITIVIPNNLKGKRSQSNNNNSSKSITFKSKTESDIESMYNVTYVDSKVISTSFSVPPAPSNDGYEEKHRSETLEMGRKYFQKYKYRLYLSLSIFSIFLVIGRKYNLLLSHQSCSLKMPDYQMKL